MVMKECGTKERYSGCPRACEQAESERVGENVLLIVTRNAVGQPPSPQSVLPTFHVPKRHPVKAGESTDSGTSIVPGEIWPIN